MAKKRLFMRDSKFLFFYFLFICLAISVTAQLPDERLKQIGKISVVSIGPDGYESVFSGPDEDLNDIFTEQMDSLISSWFFQNLYDISDGFEYNGSVVSLPDSIYINRLQGIDAVVPLSYNATVKNLIEGYTQRRRTSTEVLLGLSFYYLPMIEELLDKYGMPMELKYLPIIESAFNPNARSRANAVGLWQFMYATGKMYKLEIGTFVDERRDPQKASEAAINFLSDLYKKYRDWHLAIAAYNCGAGNVDKAIRRAGGAKNYWIIYPYLPRETRGYVPAYIAAAYLMNYYKDHGLTPRLPDFKIVTDTIMVSDYLHFDQIAENIRVSVAELKALNPQYLMNIIPGRKENPRALTIPVEHVGNYIDNESVIFAHKREEIFPNNQLAIPKGTTAIAEFGSPDVAGKVKMTYTVKSGDNPGYISGWYHVRIDDLRSWNNIRRNMIRAGQKLTVYVPKEYTDFYSQINTMSFAEKQQYAKRKPVANAAGSTAIAAASNQITNDGNYVYYTVKAGETLWGIAQKFAGVTDKDIMQLNNMGNSSIKPGQKLKIQQK